MRNSKIIEEKKKKHVKFRLRSKETGNMWTK